MRIRRLAVLVAGAAIAFVVCGYIVAARGQPICEAEMRAEVFSKGVTGLDMEGRTILPSQIDVYSRVEHPFVVVAGYSVPYDLHASYHEARFLVLPGYVHRQSSQTYRAL